MSLPPEMPPPTEQTGQAQVSQAQTGQAVEVGPENTDESWGWTRGHRITLGILLTCLLAFLIIQYIRRPYRLDDAIALQHGSVRELQLTLDPNTADAASLARLSFLGDKLAQAIVDYRDFHQDEQGITFQRLDDLRRVKGISAKMAEELRPYLRFPNDTSQPGGSLHGLTPAATIPETAPGDASPVQP